MKTLNVRQKLKLIGTKTFNSGAVELSLFNNKLIQMVTNNRRRLSMSVFVFDQDTIGMIRYILALQRFKEYSVGPQG